MSDVVAHYSKLESIARNEFTDIVTKTEIIGRRSIGSSKLRLFVKDGTIVDIWLSISGKYSYHWEQRARRGLIHRHDNAPDFPNIATFPKHFHNGSEEVVKESRISEDPEIAIREFLVFVRERIKESRGQGQRCN